MHMQQHVTSAHVQHVAYAMSVFFMSLVPYRGRPVGFPTTRYSFPYGGPLAPLFWEIGKEVAKLAGYRGFDPKVKLIPKKRGVDYGPQPYEPSKKKRRTNRKVNAVVVQEHGASSRRVGGRRRTRRKKQSLKKRVWKLEAQAPKKSVRYHRALIPFKCDDGANEARTQLYHMTALEPGMIEAAITAMPVDQGTINFTTSNTSVLIRNFKATFIFKNNSLAPIQFKCCFLKPKGNNSTSSNTPGNDWIGFVNDKYNYALTAFGTPTAAVLGTSSYIPDKKALTHDESWLPTFKAFDDKSSTWGRHGHVMSCTLSPGAEKTVTLTLPPFKYRPEDYDRVGTPIMKGLAYELFWRLDGITSHDATSQLLVSRTTPNLDGFRKINFDVIYNDGLGETSLHTDMATDSTGAGGAEHASGQDIGHHADNA
jgi:hypothetical protein